MDSLTVAIYDYDGEYIEHFCKFMNGYNKDLYKFIGFTEEDSISSFFNEIEGDYIVIFTEECILRDFIDSLKNVIILSEEAGVDRILERDVIYRYQPADVLLGCILEYCVDRIDVYHKNSYIRKNMGNVIGIYSPVSRCGKTDFSIKLAGYLNDKKVLLINLECFSNLDKRLGVENNYCIGDILYFILCNSNNFEMKFDSIVRHSSGFDFISPVKNVEDLYSIDMEMWNKLLSHIKELGKYDYIIVDIGSWSERMENVILSSDYIIVPYVLDDVQKEKVSKFEDYITRKEENMMEKIYKVNMDDMGEKLLKDIHLWIKGRGEKK